MGTTNFTDGSIVSAPGSNNWVIGRDAIIAAALRKVGKLKPGATPSADMITHGAEALNALVKEWGNDGIELWNLEWKTQALSQGADSFSLPQEALAIQDAFIRDASGSDYPVRVVPIEAYYTIPNKDDTGRPKILGVLPGQQITCYLYYVPDVGTYTLHYLQVRRLKDFDAAGDNPDLPPRWELALIYGLAELLALDMGASSERYKMITLNARKYLDRAKTGNVQSYDGDGVSSAY